MTRFLKEKMMINPRFKRLNLNMASFCLPNDDQLDFGMKIASL